MNWFSIACSQCFLPRFLVAPQGPSRGRPPVSSLSLQLGQCAHFDPRSSHSRRMGFIRHGHRAGNDCRLRYKRFGDEWSRELRTRWPQNRFLSRSVEETTGLPSRDDTDPWVLDLGTHRLTSREYREEDGGTWWYHPDSSGIGYLTDDFIPLRLPDLCVIDSPHPSEESG